MFYSLAYYFVFPFTACCLLINQANYDQLSGVSQYLWGVAHAPQEKCETLPTRRRSCRSQTQGEQQECSLCYHIRFIHRDLFLKCFYMTGGVSVSGSNLILPSRSLEKEVWPALCNCVQIESNPQAWPTVLLVSHLFIIHHSTAVR